jgi:hypothetical protein
MCRNRHLQEIDVAASAGSEARGGGRVGMKRREQLAQMESHIAQCEALIARHHEMIRNAHQKGRDASWAKDTLKALEESLRAFQKHRQLILDQLKGVKER